MPDNSRTERREDIADESKSRERFEKYAQGPKLPLERDRRLYAEYMTELAWLTWQAAERDTRERCAQIVESEPFAYITESEHEKLENFADRVRRRIRGKE